jgi:Domain of Unknown Function (DUF1259)
MKRFLTISGALVLLFASVAQAQDIPAEYQQVLTALDKTGDYKANVLKVNIPRNDVSVTVANVKTPTPFGFGGWAGSRSALKGLRDDGLTVPDHKPSPITHMHIRIKAH